MPSMRAIKRRRLTVKNISQITKAMNLVATSKLQRARSALSAVSKPIKAAFDMTYSAMQAVDLNDSSLSMLEKRSVITKTAYVLVTSNRGLCGGYNSNVCKELLKHAKANEKDAVVIPLGTKGRDYCRRRGKEIIELAEISETPNFADANKVAKTLCDMYEKGEIDEVYIVYTKFITVLALEPIIRQVLPISPDYVRRVVGKHLYEGEEWEDLGFYKKPEVETINALKQEMEFEPGLEIVLQSIVPWFLGMFIYGALASSLLCEQAARMTSMDSATKNAGDIIEKLTLMFNRQRQSTITQEITEIVSGANALQ